MLSRFNSLNHWCKVSLGEKGLNAGRRSLLSKRTRSFKFSNDYLNTIKITWKYLGCKDANQRYRMYGCYPFFALSILVKESNETGTLSRYPDARGYTFGLFLWFRIMISICHYLYKFQQQFRSSLFIRRKNTTFFHMVWYFFVPIT